MRRSDWRELVEMAAWIVFTLCMVWLMPACTRTLVPSGRPGCPNATVWSDSAQRCVTREGR